MERIWRMEFIFGVRRFVVLRKTSRVDLTLINALVEEIFVHYDPY